MAVPPAHRRRGAHVAFGPARALSLPGELPRARIGRVLGRVSEVEWRSGRGGGRDGAVAIAVAATAAAELWRHSQSSSTERIVRVYPFPLEHRVLWVGFGAALADGVEGRPRARRFGVILWYDMARDEARARLGPSETSAEHFRYGF